MRILPAVLTLLLAAPATPAFAICVPGAKCLTVPEAQKSARFEIGDRLPAGEYQMLLNSRYMGLPRPEAGTHYYRVEGRILRVRADTLEVVEDATWAGGRVSR